jgi:ABC-2 type transport system ATP-binding protein
VTGELLRATGVRMRFGRKTVLDGCSLTVRAGEAVALVGENGAGKTTLLRICAGILAPDAGAVAISGRVGYCPQEPGVFDLLTADEHLTLFGTGLGLARESARVAGGRLLADLGFPTDERVVARELSGGARQKLNLALALLGDPALLLLDEPYQGFDRGAYVSFWDHVERWRRDGRGIVVVTHLLTDSLGVDRVVELTVHR